MAMVSGRAPTVNRTSASGKLAKQKAMEYTFLKMVTNTKASGFSACVTATAQTSLPMVTATLASIRKASQKALDSTSGKTVAVTLASLRMDLNMATESGRRGRQMSTATASAISTRESMNMIRNTVMAFLNGKVAIATKETIMRMSVMATV